MDVRHLRMFVAVAEELHFGRAAQRLHMTQPPLSQGIKRLERELGAPLFRRTTRRVTLTAAGKALLEASGDVFRAFDAAADAVMRAHQGQLGTLSVGFTTLAPHQMLPRLAEHHRRTHPDVQIRPGNIPSRRQIQMLTAGRLDVGLLWLPADPQAAELREVSRLTVVRQPLVAVLPQRHRLAERSHLSLSDLRGEPFVTYISPPGGSIVREAMCTACQAAGYYPDIVQEAPDASALLSIVSAGVGVGILPDAAREMGVPGTRVLELTPPAPVLEYSLAWRPGDSSPLVRAFIETVCAIEGLHAPLAEFDQAV